MHKMTISDLTNVTPENLDKEILKIAVITELETINDFEKLAEMTRNSDLKFALLNVIREKRMAIGQLQALLMQLGINLEEISRE